MEPTGNLTVILNLTGLGSCSICDDTGLITANRTVEFDRVTYTHWACPCRLCERGEQKEHALSRRRVSWRYRDDGVAA